MLAVSSFSATTTAIAAVYQKKRHLPLCSLMVLPFIRLGLSLVYLCAEARMTEKGLCVSRQHAFEVINQLQADGECICMMG